MNEKAVTSSENSTPKTYVQQMNERLGKLREQGVTVRFCVRGQQEQEDVACAFITMEKMCDEGRYEEIFP